MASSRENSWELSFLITDRNELKASKLSRVRATLKNCFPSFPDESKLLPPLLVLPVFGGDEVVVGLWVLTPLLLKGTGVAVEPTSDADIVVDPGAEDVMVNND